MLGFVHFESLTTTQSTNLFVGSILKILFAIVTLDKIKCCVAVS